VEGHIRPATLPNLPCGGGGARWRAEAGGGGDEEEGTSTKRGLLAGSNGTNTQRSAKSLQHNRVRLATLQQLEMSGYDVEIALDFFPAIVPKNVEFPSSP
jgi:hypothetical protein